MTLQTNPQNNNDLPVAEPSLTTKLFASALFSGYSPVASGTAGSLVALAVYSIPGFETPLIIGAAVIAAFLLGLKTSTAMERRYGHDPAEVTIDEVVGMWTSLIFLPKKIFVIIAAFLIFRIFDIIKPFPARRFDSMHGGFGIMMDDLIVGVYTNLLIQLAMQISYLNYFLLK
jgi:phosphatidylglycerophosphatase A